MAQTSTSFKPGHEKLPGAGRPKGSQAIISRPLRALVSGHLDDSFERFKHEMSLLKGKDYVNAYLQTLKFILPQIQAVRLEDVTKEPRTITLKLQELMQKPRDKPLDWEEFENHDDVDDSQQQCFDDYELET